MDLSFIALLVSYCMALYLFSVSFIEAIKISNQEGLVNGTSLITSSTFALVFSIFANIFY